MEHSNGYADLKCDVALKPIYEGAIFTLKMKVIIDKEWKKIEY